MIDTKNFTFKTGVRTFEAAAFLRKCGVDIIRVKKWFQSNLENFNKIAEIVGKAEIVNNSIAISIYEKKSKDVNVICAKAADELLTISEITASFVIRTIRRQNMYKWTFNWRHQCPSNIRETRWWRTHNLSRCTSRRYDTRRNKTRTNQKNK